MATPSNDYYQGAHPDANFAITQNYAIFMDLPRYFRPQEILKGYSALYSFDASKMARFGVLPRCATDEGEIRWFELPSCFIFHSANAWEEGEEIVLITCRHEDLELDLLGEKATAIGTRRNELYEMRFNLLTGEASQKRLSLYSVEFPRINDLYLGRKLRYVYAAMMDKTAARVTDIVKYDLSAKPESGVIEFEIGTYGSEPVFVPRVPGYSSQEDDGLLIFFTHNELTGISTARVIDAKTMSAEPVEVVELHLESHTGFTLLVVYHLLLHLSTFPPATLGCENRRMMMTRNNSNNKKRNNSGGSVCNQNNGCSY